MRLIGPFFQLLSMENLKESGSLANSSLRIYHNAGVLVDEGKILEIGDFRILSKQTDEIEVIPFKAVGLPGFIDAHTHLCFAGSRAGDYEKRLSGITYQEIAAQGGGILDTVRQTRSASKQELVRLMLGRTAQLLKQGVTTCEVKSGYGLSINEEIKILEAIKEAGAKQPVQLIPTCLAAHTKPPEWDSRNGYLDEIEKVLFPLLIERDLSSRIDIFVEKGAFFVEEARRYLLNAKKAGFDICLHTDQFTRGGARLAAELRALSADHLETSSLEDIKLLGASGVIPIVLPGCSLGLGLPFANARLILDLGLPLVIASDWNPGSAPMGNLLMQAAVLGAAQKLTTAETLAGITIRAARALKLNDRGILNAGSNADIIAFDSADYREILYYQGSLLPSLTWVGGNCVYSKT